MADCWNAGDPATAVRPSSPFLTPDKLVRMDTTSLSLLERLRADPSETDWGRLLDVYRPLIRFWIGRVPDLRGEQEDLFHEVLVAVVRDIPAFDRRHAGSFRAWLREITSRRIREGVRRRNRPPAGVGDHGAEHFLARLEDPHSDLAAEWDAEHNRRVLERLCVVVRADFDPRTWDMFRAVVLDGRTVGETAQGFGVSEAAVLKNKARVLKRLRTEAGEVLD